MFNYSFVSSEHLKNKSYSPFCVSASFPHQDFLHRQIERGCSPKTLFQLVLLTYLLECGHPKPSAVQGCVSGL